LEEELRDRYRGALLGLAVGDAVGTTVEFKPPGSFPPVTDMTGGGPFDLPAGAWTDDTSMALCLADSLIATAGFDPVDQLGRYVRWWREGHRSSIGRCFDIGGSTSRALARFERDHDPYPGDRDPDGGGNGPLMKLAPVPLAYARHPEAALRRSALSARTTHGAPQAIDATRYLAAIILGAVAGADRAELIDRPEPFEPYAGAFAAEPLHDEVAALAAGTYLAKSPPEIRGGGYAVVALEAALWAVHRHDDFEATILAAVNLGGDADTTAAIAGQIAGAIHGEHGIPERWRRRVHLGEEIGALADGLLDLATTVDPDAEVVPT